MELMSIKGDTVELLYHPGESTADVGQQFAVTESDNDVQGLVIQVIANESLEYAGQQQEMIQNILEDRLAEVTDVVIDRENGLDDIRNLKRAIAKIRKRIQGTEWVQWDGWIPTRNVTITAVSPKALMEHILPAPATPLRSFTRFQNTAVHIDGPRLDMVNVVTGVKGSGKSHLAKNILYALSEVGVPCITNPV